MREVVAGILDLDTQPFLVIELPNEVIDDEVTSWNRGKYYSASKNDLELDKIVSTQRWEYIRQIHVIETNEEQVSIAQ
jgi:hypothetical protein